MFIYAQYLSYLICSLIYCIYQTLPFANLFMQVSRLLLLAGANPNALTESLNGAPALCIAAREGHSDLVSLYLEFGADVNSSDDSELPALSYAARSGHVSIIRLLTIHQAKVLRFI